MNASNANAGRLAAPQSVQGCEVHESGWTEAASTAAGLSLAAQYLSVDFRPWAKGETLAAPGSTGEVMGAVLLGRFRLDCEDETHELGPGQGILIPPGTPHTWTALEAGRLYRVTGPATA